MKIIAFGHRQNVGKDTASECLIERGWVRLSFADPLKRVVSEMCKVDLELFNDGVKKNKVIKYWNKSPRELLIMCGCKMVREFKDDNFYGESHWIKLLHLEILKLMISKNDSIYNLLENCDDKYIDINEKIVGVVITDLRFPNEFEYLKKIGAVTVRVTRNEHKYGGPDSELENHVFDYEIKNNGTKEMLWDEVMKIVSNCGEVKEIPICV